ncbi:uncharacterized protein Dana_GF23186 [Drosophila ananassae]|uniref:Tetraspanin n=1 Tax=Drosophila ananassae TaxID=7217 RepID=B3MVA3_DROAN|nr:uncharacterized protein LOC6505832 [Drosophila ananassae]EDV33168.1 uncharacterized protein Dana_GF23186 [Drosophila ananassae]
MAKRCRWCRVSRDCVLHINVVLIVIGLIFMLDVFSHLYLRSTMFPDIRLYPVVIRGWLFWIRGLTMLSYIAEAILGIWMAKQPSLIKYGGYILIGLAVLLYTVSIAVTRFMYRDRFEYFAQLLVYQMWLKRTLGTIEAEFSCCGMVGVIDYQTPSANRTWSSGSCCSEPNCPGCNPKVEEYLWTIEMDVARDNIIVSVFLALGMIVMLMHFHGVNFYEDLLEDDSDDTTKATEEENSKNISFGEESSQPSDRNSDYLRK